MRVGTTPRCGRSPGSVPELADSVTLTPHMVKDLVIVQHHPVHLLHELAAEFDQPVGIGTLIAVDTTEAVDVDALAERVATLLASGRPGR